MYLPVFLWIKFVRMENKINLYAWPKMNHLQSIQSGTWPPEVFTFLRFSSQPGADRTAMLFNEHQHAVVQTNVSAVCQGAPSRSLSLRPRLLSPHCTALPLLFPVYIRQDRAHELHLTTRLIGGGQTWVPQLYTCMCRHITGKTCTHMYKCCSLHASYHWDCAPCYMLEWFFSDYCCRTLVNI